MELHVSSLFFDKVPDFGVELVARIFEASVADSFEGAFINDPSFETGVVGARNVPSGKLVKAVEARKGVFDGDGEAVADVEVAVGVRGRHDDRIIIFARRGGRRDLYGVKNTGSFPSFVNISFEFLGFVRRSEFHRDIISF